MTVREELLALTKEKDVVMSEIGGVHKQQRAMQSVIEKLQNENSILWQELTSSQQQQQTTNETLQKIMVC